MIDGICELTLQARRPAALASFYREIFGFEEVSAEEGGERVWLACGSHTRLGIWAPGRREYGDRGGDHVHFAFSCPRGQLEQIAARLRRLGVEHRGPVEHDGGDRSLYVEDPAGNVVEVWDFFRSGEGAREDVTALE